MRLEKEYDDPEFQFNSNVYSNPIADDFLKSLDKLRLTENGREILKQFYLVSTSDDITLGNYTQQEIQLYIYELETQLEEARMQLRGRDVLCWLNNPAWSHACKLIIAAARARIVRAMGAAERNALITRKQQVSQYVDSVNTVKESKSTLFGSNNK